MRDTFAPYRRQTFVVAMCRTEIILFFFDLFVLTTRARQILRFLIYYDGKFEETFAIFPFMTNIKLVGIYDVIYRKKIELFHFIHFFIYFLIL